jgi:hypothetical protein
LNVSARPSFRPKNVVHRDLSASRIGRSSTAPNAWDITPVGPTCRLPTNIVFANTMFAECRDLALLSRASSGLYLRGLRWRRRRIDLIATEKGQGVEVGPTEGWMRQPGLGHLFAVAGDPSPALVRNCQAASRRGAFGEPHG